MKKPMFAVSSPRAIALCSSETLSYDGSAMDLCLHLTPNSLDRIRAHFFPTGSVPEEVMSNVDLALFLLAASGISEDCYQMVFSPWISEHITNLVSSSLLML